MTSGFQSGRMDAVLRQRAYYAATAEQYDELHGGEAEKCLSLPFFLAAVDHLGIGSILDIGSGTGVALLKMKANRPHIALTGVEPSEGLRKVGQAKGLSEAELVDGDAMKLQFGDGSFDLVSEFGALHHIPDPSKAVSEMLRVARKAIFISDSNNYGHGSKLSRFLKQTLRATRLWPLANLIKTRGKGYTISEGDGLAYSYSVFDNYKQIARECSSVYLFGDDGSGPNLYRTAAHVSLLGVKK